jgi:acetyl-CoA carboxylase biotin carboxyl carrier protein
MAKKSKDITNEAAATGAVPSSVGAGEDIAFLERMLAFMEQHGLEEFEYENAGLRVRLRKPAANTHRASSARDLASLTLPDIVIGGPPARAERSESSRPGEPGESANPEVLSEDLHMVKSPIVGTFYEGGSPGAAPFVKMGDQVAAGQVLCIIEAMKLMNEIESDAAGEIVRRYVENGQPVEYGEALFAIRTTRKK